MLRSLLLLLFAAPVVAAAPVPKGKEEAATYFPTVVGDTRVYEWKTGDAATEAYSDVVTQVEQQVNGSKHVTVRRSNPKGPPSSSVVAVSAAGLSRVADGDRVSDAPVVLFKSRAAVGTAWEAGGAKYEVVAVEEVTVAAGTYKAVKVERSSGVVKTALWFAPAVGVVRMTTGDGGRVLELKAFKPGK